MNSLRNLTHPAWLAVSLVAIAVLPRTSFSEGPTVVRAQQFLLVDEKDIPHASLAMDRHGACLKFFGRKEGDVAISLDGPPALDSVQPPRWPGLKIRSEDGKSAIELVVRPGSDKNFARVSVSRSTEGHPSTVNLEMSELEGRILVKDAAGATLFQKP